MHRPLSSLDHERVQSFYKELRGEIESGELTPGQFVTYPELQKRHRWVSCTIVAHTLRLLREDGLVETRPRLGTRVVIAGQTWTVPDRDKAVPLATYVERKLRERLADRIYPPTTRIPTLEMLADEFGVSVSTIRNALTPLFDAGYLFASNHKAAGTLVTQLVGKTPRHELLSTAKRPSHPRGTEYVAWGEAKTLAEWSRDSRCVVSYSCLKARVHAQSWPFKSALTTPVM